MKTTQKIKDAIKATTIFEKTGKYSTGLKVCKKTTLNVDYIVYNSGATKKPWVLICQADYSKSLIVSQKELEKNFKVVYCYSLPKSK